MSRHYQAWSLALTTALLIYRQQQAFNVLYEQMFNESLAVIRDFYKSLGTSKQPTTKAGTIRLLIDT